MPSLKDGDRRVKEASELADGKKKDRLRRKALAKEVMAGRRINKILTALKGQWHVIELHDFITREFLINNDNEFFEKLVRDISWPDTEYNLPYKLVPDSGSMYQYTLLNEEESGDNNNYENEKESGDEKEVGYNHGEMGDDNEKEDEEMEDDDHEEADEEKGDGHKEEDEKMGDEEADEEKGDGEKMGDEEADEEKGDGHKEDEKMGDDNHEEKEDDNHEKEDEEKGDDGDGNEAEK
jgi:hypothetical protein